MRDKIDNVVRFHGHMCPGLAIGIRAAEIALREIGPHAEDEEVIAIVETDMCAVDAIQYLVGCTFGRLLEEAADRLEASLFADGRQTVDEILLAVGSRRGETRVSTGGPGGNRTPDQRLRSCRSLPTLTDVR